MFFERSVGGGDGVSYGYAAAQLISPGQLSLMGLVWHDAPW